MVLQILKYLYGGIIGFDGYNVQYRNNINLANIDIDISGDIPAYYIGGVIGNISTNGVIQTNVNLGNVQSRQENSKVGGICGTVDFVNTTSLTLDNCYFLKNSTVNTNLNFIGDSEEVIGEIKATKEEILNTTFLVDTLGFDTSIWKIENNKNPEIRY